MFIRSQSWRSVFTGLSAAAVLLCVAAGCKKDDKAGGSGGGTSVDLSTPKAAALSFAKAVQNNDAAAMRSNVDGDGR